VAIRVAGALVLLLLSGGSTAASVATDVHPFIYTFQVTSVEMHATFTKGTATATTELHLSSVPRRKSLSWWGKKNYSNANGEASAVLHLTGSATYAGFEGECNTTVQFETSRWKQPIFAGLGLASARDPVVTHPTLSVAAGRFPLATIYPRRGGACENGALPWWEGGTAVRSLSVLRKPSFSFTARYSKSIEDGATLDWTVQMTVRKIQYRSIDCSHTQLC
jgi:hypothetical protein